MKVLITGFEPIKGHPDKIDHENPSEKIINFVVQTKKNDADIIGKILPVSFRKANRKLFRLLDNIKPDYLIMFGYHRKANCFHIEKKVINEVNTFVNTNRNGKGALTDNDGVSIKKRKIGKGPPYYSTTFPIHKLTKAFDKYRIPYIESNSPGTFVCNYSLFSALRKIEQTGLHTKAALIHIPSFRKPLTYSDGSKKKVSIDQVIKSLQHIF